MCLRKLPTISIEKRFPEPAGTVSSGAYTDICRDTALFNNDLTEIYVPDTEIKVYNKQDILDYLGVDETDKITYSLEDMDCDDFARIMFGKGLSLIWTNNHAINYFITPEGVLYFVEPQNDLVSVNIDGMHIRFFIGA